MLQRKHGNLLDADVEALVNTVNCVGVMGKGIALQFKQVYPDNFKQYAHACQNHEVQFGKMFIVPTNKLINPRYIINFPTKYHWKEKSRLENIEAGLEALVNDVTRLGIHSIAIPPLGSGNGGLAWLQVAPLIEKAFAPLTDVQVLLYEPEGSPMLNASRIATKKPELNRARAIMLKLIELYRSSENYGLTQLEVQKLVYFVQVAGEPMRLNFVKQQYGPYAEQLNFLLQHIEGHYITGYGDRTGNAEISLLPNAIEMATSYLQALPEARHHLERVAHLIEGFDTPHGMELLATVHWVVQEKLEVSDDISAIISQVHNWNQGKRDRFKPDHIQKAWHRLKDQAWI